MIRWPLAALVLAPGAVVAEIKDVSPHGFMLEATATVRADVRASYAALVAPARWWNPAHSYSGDARNVNLDARAGGCFCERVPKTGATIEHGRVVYVEPGRILRLRAALGPLQAEGVSAALTWTITPRSDGGSDIAVAYLVGGYVRGGAAALAAPVDQVMTEQLARLKAYLERE